MRTETSTAPTPFLKSLPETTNRALPSARVLRFEHGQTIYHQGENASSLFCVVQGQVKLSRLTIDGKRLTTAGLSAGDLFGHALGGADKEPEMATASGPTRIWRCAVDELQRVVATHPPSAWALIEALARRQMLMERRLETFAFKTIEARLAATFHDLSGGFATRCEHGFGQHLRLTQQELADLVGASRPVVSTILNRLRRQGVLAYSREYVCVRDFDEIQRLVES